MSQDQKFFDLFSLVIGGLVVIAIVLLILAMKLSDMTQGVYNTATPEYQESIAERLEPVGDVLMPGEEAPAGGAVASPAAQPDPVATTMSGPQVYNSACLVCHGAGVGGAPIMGDADAWSARIAQGNDILYMHALEGYTGDSGFMPAKGARMDLSDDEVRSAVDYMVSESGGN